MSASIGFVAIDREFCDYTTIMSSVDSACYAAKESGRNALVVYSEDDDAVSERTEEINWQPKLQSALEQGSFRLLVQAITVLEKGTVKPAIQHYEFLLRLLDSENEEISPYKFIKAAERYDMMAKIDRWVLENAFMHISKLLNKLDEQCTFSINLSGQSLSDPQILDYIRTLFARHEVSPECVWFEITETAAISQYSTASILLQGLREMGAKVALDDFGSGLSSFVYLQKLPVDILKIDGQFVKEVDINPVARQMVSAIDQMAKALGLLTVAEFVESAAVMEVLSDIGVDYAQGYHIARPCAIEAILSDSKARKAA
ncbi:Cyclic di-GMP phosphodiesterase PdeB [Granulosicoccus antarcticus IMCC3135]|uniref:Cyclic di-GMP phosphodiesterase PdeB n=2 Tax=Granulosicoccus TaxID=437504 RepID=A0A2Z2P619_9GAMM|nr:Cyclic di-GMP phosphodiesterase PdeB [Granulosicoccus antarcticus IMCC3135]